MKLVADLHKDLLDQLQLISTHNLILKKWDLELHLPMIEKEISEQNPRAHQELICCQNSCSKSQKQFLALLKMSWEENKVPLRAKVFFIHHSLEETMIPDSVDCPVSRKVRTFKSSIYDEFI